MKFTKPFYGVPVGEIYPVWYAVGDECPPELQEAAQSVDAVEEAEQAAGQQADEPQGDQPAAGDQDAGVPADAPAADAAKKGKGK